MAWRQTWTLYGHRPRPRHLRLASRSGTSAIPTAIKILELFGLTSAEAMLAAALCSGKTLAEIACERGTTVQITRTQLKKYLRQDRFSRQATRTVA